MTQGILNSYTNILILNGTLPPQSVVNKINWNTDVTAADGALAKAQQHNIKVDYLVGDLDSASSSKITIPNDIEIHHNPDQNSCDFEKCIDFLRAKKSSPTLIIGINGGEIDHIINNIHIMAKHHRTDGEFFFLDGNEDGIIKLGMILTRAKKFTCEIGETISIFPLPEAIITTQGLQYPLTKKSIHQSSGILCSRNKTISKEIEINVHQGMVLVVIDIML